MCYTETYLARDQNLLHSFPVMRCPIDFAANILKIFVCKRILLAHFKDTPFIVIYNGIGGPLSQWR